MERSSFGPLGKDLHDNGSRFRDSRGCSLACSKKRVVVDDVEVEGDTSVQDLGIFKKLLDFFEAWLVWACGHKAKFGLYSSFGLKWRMGRKRVVFGWARCVLGLGPVRWAVGPIREKKKKKKKPQSRVLIRFMVSTLFLWV